MTVIDLPPTAEDEAALLAWLATMRDEHPVWRDRYGMWHVFRHDDVEAILRDPATFSSDTARLVPAAAPVRRVVVVGPLQGGVEVFGERRGSVRAGSGWLAPRLRSSADVLSGEISSRPGSASRSSRFAHPRSKGHAAAATSVFAAAASSGCKSSFESASSARSSASSAARSCARA